MLTPLHPNSAGALFLLLHLIFAAAAATAQSLQLPLAQPTGIAMQSSLPALREHALRNATYAGKTNEVFKAIATEYDPDVLRSTLDALASVGALREGHIPYVLGLARSPNEATAVLGYSLLPACAADDNPTQVAPEAQEPSIYRHGLAHFSPRVRAAAARAAVKTQAALNLLPEFNKLATSANPDDRRVGIGALIARTTQQKLVLRATPPQEIAAKLFAEDPTRSKDIVSGLLQIGLSVPPSLYTQFYNLPEKELYETVARYGDFPDFYDNDFLRKAAMLERNHVAETAIRLLASRPSPKNIATLDTLSLVLAQGRAARLAPLLANFSAPPDFAVLYRIDLANNAPITVSANNDRFGATAGSVPNALLGEALAPDELLMQTRYNVPESQRPTLRSLRNFIEGLESLGAKNTLDAGTLTNARRLFLQERGAGSLPNVISHLLGSGHPDNVQQAIDLAMVFVGDEHLLEIVLQNYATDTSPIRAAQLLPIDAFLPRTTPIRSRLLSRMGRLLVASSHSEKHLLGLVLLSAHGNPSDTTYISPSLNSPDVLTRRAAYHALARVAPETFLLRMKATLADPDPLIRTSAALLFTRTGFRWEHHLSPSLRIAQWVPPNAEFSVKEEDYRQLAPLETDPDPEVRLRTLLASLQHGRLANTQKLLDLQYFAPNPSLHTARLQQSIAAAKAAKKNIPPALASLGPSNEETPPRAPTIVLFVSPETTLNNGFNATMDALAATFHGIRILTWYNGTAATDAAKAAIFRHYPVPYSQKGKSVLVFSSGAWEASDSLPDFARLQELIAHANDTNPRRLERILNLETMPAGRGHPKPPNPFFTFPNVLIPIIAGVAILLTLGLGTAKGLQALRWYHRTQSLSFSTTQRSKHRSRKKRSRKKRKNKSAPFA
ncbi:MAG: hypothetical protein LBD01_03290 [Puniceicoccales bacterium]|jgi:hypothetical protein|nr:hypothetical protein [Puniceicoccales bacterium]